MAGFRVDGRMPDQLRPTTIRRSYLETASGSVLIESGGTRLICTVSIENRVPPFVEGTGRGWLTCEYGMLPGSSRRRIPRETASGRPNSRTREIQRMIGRSLRAITDLGALGERTLYVDCDVIQADGGTRTAAITGGYVALVEAICEMRAEGLLDVDPITGQLAAVSCGLVNGQALLDLCYPEDSSAATDMNVVMTRDGKFVEIQATAEGEPFSRNQLDSLLNLASKGIAELFALQTDALGDLIASEEVVADDLAAD